MVKGVKTAVRLIKGETIKELLSKPLISIQTIFAKSLMMSYVIPSKTSTPMQRYFYSTQKPDQGKIIDQPNPQVSSQQAVQQLKNLTENDQKEQKNNSQDYSGKEPEILQKQQLLEQRRETKQNVGPYKILMAMQIQIRQEQQERKKRQESQERQKIQRQERQKKQSQEIRLKFCTLLANTFSILGLLGFGSYFLYIYQRTYIKENSAKKTLHQLQAKSIMDQKARKQKIEEQINLKIDKLIKLVTSKPISQEIAKDQQGKTLKLEQMFTTDSLNMQIIQFLNKQYYNQILKVIYGRPGIGKTTSILHYAVQKFTLKEPFLYLTFNNLDIEKGYKGHQNLSLIIQVFSDQNLKNRFLQKLKTVKDIKMPDGYYFTLVIDQINKLEKCHEKAKQDPKFIDLIDQSTEFISEVYQLNSAQQIHVVLVSSDKKFVRTMLFSNPGIREDKFTFQQAQITKKDVQDFIRLQIQNENVVKQLLKYNDNKGDLLDYIATYLKASEESKNEGEANTLLTNKLQQMQQEKFKEVFLAQLPTMDQINTQILLKICLGNPISWDDYEFYGTLIKKKILYDDKSFMTKMLLKGFEKYYNAQMKAQKKEPVQCTSRQTY